MEKARNILYYVSLGFSALVGLWHFFVPRMFRWYDYLPMQYKNLIVGIDYTNYCFSALLLGSSLVLIILGKSALALNMETLVFHTMLTLVWVSEPVSPFYRTISDGAYPSSSDRQLLLSLIMALMMVRQCQPCLAYSR